MDRTLNIINAIFNKGSHRKGAKDAEECIFEPPPLTAVGKHQPLRALCVSSAAGGELKQPTNTDMHHGQAALPNSAAKLSSAGPLPLNPPRNR